MEKCFVSRRIVVVGSLDFGFSCATTLKALTFISIYCVCVRSSLWGVAGFNISKRPRQHDWPEPAMARAPYGWRDQRILA